MDPNFERLRRRFERSQFQRGFHSFRGRLYRSSNGKLLGVLSGLAESLGFRVCATRWIGIFALLFIASSAGAHGCEVTLLVCGFFYLLLALIMQPPRNSGAPRTDNPDPYGHGPRVPPPMPPPPSSWRPAASRDWSTPAAVPRPNFAELDRQLDSLNKRIQRMETVVTDRQYDWERRMQD